jgi:hypothetical protein
MADDFPPPEFYDVVDRFFGMTSERTRDLNILRASAAVMAAAARYYAHCILSLNTDAREYRGAAVEYVVQQYRSLLEEKLDQIERSRKQADPGTTGPDAK